MVVEREVELTSGLGGDEAGKWQTVYESDDIFELADVEVHPQLSLAGWFRIVVGVDVPDKREPEPITGIYFVQGGKFAWTPLANVKTQRVAAKVESGPPGRALRLKFKLTVRGLKE